MSDSTTLSAGEQNPAPQLFSVYSAGDLANAITQISAGPISAIVYIYQSIQLEAPLPCLNAPGQTVSIEGTSSTCAISGANAATSPGGSSNWYPIFNIAAGGVTISNLTLQYAGALGLVGGTSNPQCGTGGGGGGGMGAGGALFVGPAANVTVSSCNFEANIACGGAGGQALDESGYEGAGGFGGGLNGTNFGCGGAGAAGSWGGSAGAGGNGSAIGAGGGGGGGSDTLGGEGGAGAYGGGGGGGGGSPVNEPGGPGGPGGAWAGMGGGGGIGGGSGGGGAGLGGAIFVCGGGVVTLQNCTTSGNLAVGGPYGLSPADGYNGDAGAGAGTAMFLQGALATIEVDAGNTVAFQGDTIACDANSTLVKQGGGTLQLASTPPPATSSPFATPANLGAVFGSAAINVAAGTLVITGTQTSIPGQPALGVGTLAVQPGATLSGSGYFSNAITVATDGTLEVTDLFVLSGCYNEQYEDEIIAPGSIAFSPQSTLTLPLAGGPFFLPGNQVSWPENLQLNLTASVAPAGGTYTLVGPTPGITAAILATWAVTLPAGYANGGLSVGPGGTVQIAVYPSGGAGNYVVTSTADDGSVGTLRNAIAWANAGLITSITIGNGGPLTVQLGGQICVNANVSIDGNGSTINGGGDRIFFLAGGTISITNVTLANGLARGGSGTQGGGGGAGLGGAVFVANGAGIPGSAVSLPTNVSLVDVSFVNNQAGGGAGSSTSGTLFGGGGGMGGNGGSGNNLAEQSDAFGGGGGGGFGVGADGGDASNDTPTNGSGGAFGFALANAPAVSGAAAGAGGMNPHDDWDDQGSVGGAAGGGGGGASNAGFELLPLAKASVTGGGGGVGGTDGCTDGSGTGGMGGFGGGGGGAGGGTAGSVGGFGGGAGAGFAWNGGNPICGAAGGFGGGGSGGINASTPAPGGFGGGSGFGGAEETYGGGGAGLGGALFVQAGAQVTITDGAYSGNSTFPGAASGGDNAGMCAGAAFFLGADLTYAVSQTKGEVIIADDLGGGLLDPSHPDDPNASGQLTFSGPGMLTIAGYSTVPILNAAGGILNLTGTIASSVIAFPGTVAGTGTVARTIEIAAGGTLQPGYPGNAVGALTCSDLIWRSNGSYNWQVGDSACAGVTVTGGILDLSQASSKTPFVVNLWSLSSVTPPVSGALSSFSPTNPFTWVLVTTTGGVQFFTNGCVVVNTQPANGTAGFANAVNGTFSVEVSSDGLSLLLLYVPATS